MKTGQHFSIPHQFAKMLTATKAFILSIFFFFFFALRNIVIHAYSQKMLHEKLLGQPRNLDPALIGSSNC